MTSQVNDIKAFFNENGVYANVLQYNSSFFEPITDETRTNLFSDENRRLTEDEKRFQLYNGYGEFYLDGADISDMIAKSYDMQKNGLTATLPYDDISLEGIIDLIRPLQGSVSVYGTNQKRYDSWEVLDDQLLDIALYREMQTGNQQLSLVNEDGRDYLVNKDNIRVLVRQLPSEQESAWTESFYEVRTPDGKVILSQIPLEKLGLVLLGLINGFTFGQIESTFLWPNMSKDVLSDAQLLFVRNFSSDAQKIMTENDFKKVDELAVQQDNDHLSSIYQYCGGEKNWRIGLAFPQYEFTEFYDYLYHNKSNKSEDVIQKLSDFIIGLANECNVSILRKERRLLNISTISKLAVEEEGGISVGANIRPKSRISMVETVFTLKDKSDPETTIKQEITIDELVSYFLLRAKHDHAND